ncbi:neurosecretory protein VGF [Myripristis murdjan]|uniref:neurosecretory protein VGF n=1 Tax=Myripristis murdjan TaxID=586833 RepID=UPI001175E266|nr:neurosecretory protein VGF-like [Myripristis murdjan]
MIGYHDASSALTLLILLTGASFLNLSTSSPVNTLRLTDSLHRVSSSGLAVVGNRERRAEENGSMQTGGEGVEEEEEDEDEDELFKDVDPKTLAAVLLEALNKPQMERRREGDEGEGTEEEEKEEREEATKENEKAKEVRAMDGVNRDRDRNGRQELELMMAAQGREEREREEEEERRKAQEEEEKLTERVTSRTISQTVPVKTEQQSTTTDEGGEEILGKDAAFQQGPTSLSESQQQGDQNTDEEEEQLNPEELKNLETMMKEFPSLSTASKIVRDSQQHQRESRGYSPYNDIIPDNKGYDLAMSKKKLKWQEETQKAMTFPTFRGGNFMDEFEDNNFNNAGSNAVQQLPPAENDVMEDDEPEEAEDEEEVLSPEEEEARAKAEQEEVRRQAAEAQRAKMEEEKLADIASDMLLQYMVKQNNGNRKDRDQNRKYSSLSNAAEDKRSDEEQEVMEEDDDIDPQTIDKLIEISSKLHLPADDVVDIISDVEKKKKKDVPPEMASPWQRPLMPLSSSSSSTNGVSASQIPNNRNTFLSKQTSPAVNPLKAWFQERPPTKSSLGNQDLWIKPSKPMSGNQERWPKLQKPLSTNQDLWLKPQKSFWTSYPPYSTYPSYYQKKPYRGYYPIYFPPPSKPKFRYYVPKPALNLNSFLGNSADYDYYSPPKRRFRNWVQPRLRKPPANLQQSYYSNYVLPSYTRTFQPLPIPKPRSASRMAVIPRHQPQYYYSPAAPIVTRDEDYYSSQSGRQADKGKDDDLEKYIQEILMKQPRMFE